MKYYYSLEHDVVAKMGIKDDKLTINLGHDPYVSGKDEYQVEKDYIQAKYCGVTYKFITGKVKKRSSVADGTVWMYPCHEEKVVKIHNQFYLFEKLSTSDLLQEAYAHLYGATLNSYMDQKMDDPEMTLKLLHRLHWKLRTEFNVPGDEIMDFNEIQQEIEDLENS